MKNYMRVIYGVNKKKALKREAVVTVGAFDGIHLGHRKIIEDVVKAARRRNLQSVVVTFEPHPSKILSDNPEPLLLTLQKKLDMLDSFGIDTCLVIKFNRSFSRLTPRDFAKKVLVDYLKAKVVLVGFDYVFGKGRKGNAKLLSRLGREYGFSIREVKPVKKGSEIVSSTRIRELIRQGNISRANCLLGRTYEITGTVEKGERRGGILGYPTANLGNIDVLLPAPGVYAGRAILAGRTYKAALNLGLRPTFSKVSSHAGTTPSCAAAGLRKTRRYIPEVHLVGFKGNIYGKRLSFLFMHRIRDEIAFQSVRELREQIALDLKKPD